MKKVEEFVRFYFNNGMNVIPAQKGKKFPVIPTWKVFQSNKVTGDMIDSWLKEGMFGNINLCLGSISNLWEIDVDVKNAPVGIIGFFAKGTWICESSDGKLKVFFRQHEGYNIPSKLDSKINDSGEHVELRGDNHLSVLPPSIHPSGSTYTWLSDVEKTPLQPIDGQKLYDSIVDALRKENAYQEEIQEEKVYTRNGDGVRGFFLESMKEGTAWSGQQGHYFRLAFCAELINNNYTDEQIHIFFKTHDKNSGERYSFQITQAKINELRKKGMHCWSMKKLQEACGDILAEVLD
jgi:hypothetical protein